MITHDPFLIGFLEQSSPRRRYDQVMLIDYERLQAKLSSAIEVLVSHPGQVRARLLAAYDSLRTLDRTDFPEALRGEFQWIMERLHTPKAPPMVREYYKLRHPEESPTVHYVLGSLNHRSGTEVARRLYSLLLSCVKASPSYSVLPTGNKPGRRGKPKQR